MLKLTRLFYSTVVNGTFEDNIEVEPEQRQFLVDCKNKIREHLRPAIEAASTGVLGMEHKVTPRFRTQGSWAYGTCVHPCTLPPQEMDWDFGVYLPITLWEENGPPARMAEAYFQLVETLLTDLCKREGWFLDKSKDNCSRVQVASWAHIDVPLYAASEDEFVKVRETQIFDSLRKADSAGIAMDARDKSESEALGDLIGQSWDDMEGLVLAKRSGEWVPSDPADVSKWFKDCIEEHGEQLRRVCRFLKAWRDFRWNTGGPTSVSIMIAVAQSFVPVRGRDDLAIEQGARALAKALKFDIRERGIDGGKDDFNRLEESERVEASSCAYALAEAIRQARESSLPYVSHAISLLQAQLGSRLPNKPEWVESDSSGDDIRRVPASTVSKPVVGAQSAG